MRWLIRQWSRFQLARELLEQYEYEDTHRMSWPEAIEALTGYAKFAAPPDHSAADRWREAIEAHVASYEATGRAEAS